MQLEFLRKNSDKFDQVIHEKTGKLYYILDAGTDCTNKRDGTKVIIYTDESFKHTYVRESNEFFNKFKLKYGNI